MNAINSSIPDIINHLAKVNRRYYIVGLFNGHPNHRDKLYYFGPNANKQTLRTAIQARNDTKIVCDTQNSFDSFLDTVEPSVQESLTEGNNAIQIGAPVDQNSTGSIHKVNTFLLLYKDTKLPQGQELLKQLSDDVNLYLDLMRDVDQLVVAFNRFFYHHRQNNITRQWRQLPASGVKFHDNFAQILLQFLVLEEVDKLDYTSLNWDSFGSDWPQNEKEIFADIVKDFRIALLNEKHNEIDDKLRTQFQQRRQALLRTGKTLQSKFMLSLLSYWIFNSLLGTKASVTDDSKYNNLFQHISAQDERQRKLQLPTTGQEVTLPAPRVTLEKEEVKKLQKKVEDVVSQIIDACSDNDEARKKQLKHELSTYMTQEEIDEVFRQFSTMYEVGRQGGNPEETKKIFRNNFLIALREVYIPLLIGESVTRIEDVQEKYESDHTGLRVQTELYQTEVLEQLRANAKRNQLSEKDLPNIEEKRFKNTQEQQKVVMRWVAGSLGPLSRTLNPNFLKSYQALQEYVHELSKQLITSQNSLEIITDIKHSKQSEGNVPIAPVTVSAEVFLNKVREQPVTVNIPQTVQFTAQTASDVGESVAESASLTASNPVSSFEDRNTEPVEESNPGQTNNDLINDAAREREEREKLLELLSSLAGGENSSPEQAAAQEDLLETGANNLVTEAKEALKSIWEVRDRNDVTPSYRQRFTRLGLAELMLVYNKKLQFNEALSGVYNLVLDLMLYGSDNLQEFLENHSLTSYFDINNAADLKHIYVSLEKQTFEAKQAMARFISEVRGIEYLFTVLKDELDSGGCELLFYNGDYNSFMSWVDDSKKTTKQYWNPGLVKEDRFIYPSVIYFLESALSQDAFSKFFNILSAYDPQGVNDNSTSALFPITLLSPLDNFAKLEEGNAGQQQNTASVTPWYADFSNLSGNGFPFLAYGVGPAVQLEKNSILKLPAGFLVLEKLILTLNNKPVKPVSLLTITFDSLTNVVNKSQLCVLDRFNITVENTLQKLLIEKTNDKLIPLEGALWLNMVGLIYNYVKATGANINQLKRDFSVLFDNQYIEKNVRQNNRRQIASCLSSLDSTNADSSLCYGLDLANQQLVIRIYPDGTQTIFNLPWLNKVIQ